MDGALGGLSRAADYFHHGPFLNVGCYAALDKFSPSSPHPPISSSSGSSSPRPDDSDHLTASNGSSARSPTSLSSRSRSEESAVTEATECLSSGLRLDEYSRSKRRKQGKPTRRDDELGKPQDESRVKSEGSDDSPRGEMPHFYGEREELANGLWHAKGYDEEENFEGGRNGCVNGKEEDASTSASSPGSTSPGIRKSAQNSGSIRSFPMGPSGARIFNPDAYCHLCQREFCNKYFLKTHKANKHNVYDLDSVGELGGENGPQNGTTASLSASPTLPPDHPNLDATDRDRQPGVRVADAKHEVLDSSAAGLDKKEIETHQLRLICAAQNWALQQMMQRGSLFMPMMPPFGPLGMPPFGAPFFDPQALMMPHPAVFDSAKGVPSLAVDDVIMKSSSEKIDRISNDHPQNPAFALIEEVFCEICRKKMSSKSFLRRHMRKKHNIDDGFSDGGRPSPAGDIQHAKKRRHKEKHIREQKQGSVVHGSVPDEYPKMSPGSSVAQNELAINGSENFPTAPAGSNAHLQRMLMNFGDGLKPGRRETFPCPVCRTEFASAFYLETHYMKEHAHDSSSLPPSEPAVLDLSTPKQLSSRLSPPRVPKPLKRLSSRSSPPSSPAALSSAPGGVDLESFCIKCNREYCSKYFLRTHLKKVHGVSTEEYLVEVQMSNPEVWRKFIMNGAGMGDKDPGMDCNGDGAVGNYCKYCKKRFCNKYFFKTHMKKMHNEDVQEHIGSGRGSRRRSTSVSCDVCGKVLCSKYFLKIHKRNAHNIIDPSLPASLADGLNFSSLNSMESMDDYRNQADMDDSDDEMVSQAKAPDLNHMLYTSLLAFGEKTVPKEDKETESQVNGHESFHSAFLRKPNVLNFENGNGAKDYDESDSEAEDMDEPLSMVVEKRGSVIASGARTENDPDNRRSPFVKEE